MDLLVDVQGFKTEVNRFIFKEIAYTSPECDVLTSYLLRPPFPWSELSARYKSQNLWLIRNFHGLLWNSGVVDYDFLQQDIENAFNKTSTIYVKGLEKLTWMVTTFPNIRSIVDLDNLGCPSLVKLHENHQGTTCCSSHVPVNWQEPNCAIRNVTLLKQWFSSSQC